MWGSQEITKWYFLKLHLWNWKPALIWRQSLHTTLKLSRPPVTQNGISLRISQKHNIKQLFLFRKRTWFSCAHNGENTVWVLGGSVLTQVFNWKALNRHSVQLYVTIQMTFGGKLRLLDLNRGNTHSTILVLSPLLPCYYIFWLCRKRENNCNWIVTYFTASQVPITAFFPL